MKTSQQLIDEVEAELNAINAADMGLEAIAAFTQEAINQFAAGDVIKTKDALNNLSSLIGALRKAIPANVIPATAGAVGKSPHEQYLEQAHDVVEQSLAKMQETIKPLRDTLMSISEAVTEAATAAAAIKAVPKND